MERKTEQIQRLETMWRRRNGEKSRGENLPLSYSQAILPAIGFHIFPYVPKINKFLLTQAGLGRFLNLVSCPA